MMERQRPRKRFHWRLWASALAIAVPLSAPASATSIDDIDLNTLSGVYLAARIAEAGRDFASAAAFYRAAHENDPENLVLLDRALVLTAAEGDIETAIGFAEKLVEVNADNRIGRLLLAVSAIRGKTYSAAIAEMEKSGNGVLVKITRNLIKTWAQAGMNDFDAALATVDELQGEDWYETFQLQHGGLIAAAGGRWDEALSRLGEAYSRDENAIRIAEAYVRTLANAGKRDRATALMDEYISRNPHNPGAQRLAAELKSDKSIELMVTDPLNGVAEILSGLGAAIGQDENAEIAALYLRLAAFLSPQGAGGLTAITLGELLAGQRQAEAAIEVFESVAEEAPYKSLALVRSALALDQLDRVDEAIAAFEQAIADAPDNPQIRIMYGSMLRARKEFDEASKIYSGAIDLIPKPTRSHWTWYYFRGITHERSKRWELAEADFKQALKLFPDQPLVLNYLGYSWVDMGAHLDEALDMIKKAVELRPNDGYIVDSLGWAYYRLGRFEEAVTKLERAVTLRPEDPIINDHLGDAYWQVGRTLEAQFQWRHARDLGAEEPELEIIGRKIEEGRLIEKELPINKTEAEEGGDPLAPENTGSVTPASAEYYIVKKGQSLWQIAVDVFDDGFAYKKILDANRDQLPDADAIQPGMKLRIPRGL